jgi:hypothetical protein
MFTLRSNCLFQLCLTLFLLLQKEQENDVVMMEPNPQPPAEDVVVVPPVPTLWQQLFAPPANAPPQPGVHFEPPERSFLSQRMSLELPFHPTNFDVLNIVTGLERDFAKAFHSALRSAGKVNLARPTRIRKIKCDAPFWRHCFWSRLAEPERTHKGPGPLGLYKAEILSLERLIDLFGDGHLFREAPNTLAFSFIAPKARVTTKWGSAAAGTLKLEEGDYLAVLREVPDSPFVIAYQPCAPASRVDYQGHTIQGAIGYCPRNVFVQQVPFSLRFSPRIRQITCTFSCWVFNSNGNLLSNAFSI